MELYDFDKCEYSIRDGFYGGMAGDKAGVIFNNANWIIKFPKSTKNLQGKDLPSYTTSPLSEYIGSHIYRILGFDVHETLLGIRNNKIVVACKDFCENDDKLLEIRTIKNAANDELNSLLELNHQFEPTSNHLVSIETMLLQFKYNRVLNQVDGVEDRFWDQFVIDCFINNNDRNNGNWGLLARNNKLQLAPIFDNGGCLHNKVSDERALKLLGNNSLLRQNALYTQSIFTYNNKILTMKDFFTVKNENLDKAIIRNVHLIESKLEDICLFIRDIPNEYFGLEVCSEVRKKYYIESLKLRFEEILLSKYYELTKDKQKEQFNGKYQIENQSEMFQETIRYLYNSKEKELDLSMDEIHSLVEVGIYNKNPNYMKDFIDDCDKYGIEKEWNEEDQQYVFHLNKDLLNQFDLSSFDQTINDDAGIERQTTSKDKGISM